MKYCQTLYTLPDNDLFNEKIFETNKPITKLIDEFKSKVNEKNFNSTRTAQIYFTHKLIHVSLAFLNTNKSLVFFKG
jgi:hypothetical protein